MVQTRNIGKREAADQLIDRLAELYEAAIAYTHAGLIEDKTEAQLYSDLSRTAHDLAFDGSDGIRELKEQLRGAATPSRRGRGR
jgi:hypothetical protein